MQQCYCEQALLAAVAQLLQTQLLQKGKLKLRAAKTKTRCKVMLAVNMA